MDKANTAQIRIQADQAKAISADLFGIFFEDINYAADGGLYAELIQNRSFEYSSADNPDWNFFTAWELVLHHGECSLSLETETPIHPNNPHYLGLHLDGAVALRNTGFDGIVYHAGEGPLRFVCSIWANRPTMWHRSCSSRRIPSTTGISAGGSGGLLACVTVTAAGDRVRRTVSTSYCWGSC